MASDLKQYAKRPGKPVAAVKIDLELEAGGFAYRKWGREQWAKQGDWLVLNGDETYTVDAETFAATYERVDVGQYVKTGKVWAERAEFAGQIETKEGHTAYEAGDYLVYNQPDRGDGYAVKPEIFEATYQAC